MVDYKKINLLKNNVNKMRIKIQSGVLKNTSLIKKIRREIARLHTGSARVIKKSN